MPRAMWKGNISFGLVMVPVVMYNAESPAAGLDLDMIDSKTRERVKYQRINERTGKEVPWKQIAKGYKVDDEYVILTPDDFKKAAANVVRGIEIMEFVPAGSVSPLYYQKPYYLLPGKGGEKVYTLLRETLKKTGRTGIAKAVIHTREHLAELVVIDDVLTLLILRFAEELRLPSEVAKEAGGAKPKVNPRELKMAEQLVKGMESTWDPERHHDEYMGELKKFVETKARAGGKAPASDAADDDEAPASYNIMDLLRQSVEHKGSRTAKKTKKTASRTASRTARPKRKAG